MTLDPNALPVVTLALEGNGGLTQVASVADQTVRQRLARVEGVAAIQVQGGQTRQVKVALDPAKLAMYGISASQVAQVLSAQNLSASAATVDRGSGSIDVEVGHTFQNAQEIGQIPIPVSAPAASSSRSGSTQAAVPLDVLGRIIDGYADASQYTYVNGKPAVVLSVQKASTANTVRVAAGVEQTVRQLNAGQLPTGVHLSTVLNQADYINLSIGCHVFVAGNFYRRRGGIAGHPPTALCDSADRGAHAHWHRDEQCHRFSQLYQPVAATNGGNR